MPGPDTVNLHLRDYVRMLRRRKFIVLAVLAVFVGVALIVSLFQSPVYAAKARLLLQPRNIESLFDPTFGQRPDPARAVQTEIEVLKSAPVSREVRRQLGTAPKVSARPVGATDVIEVVATHRSPKKAADVANAYVRAYIDFRRQQAVEDLLAASAQIRETMDRLQAEIDRATGSDRDALVQQRGVFKQKLDELNVDRELKRGGAQLVAEATVPTSPVAPKPLRYAAFATVLGAALGIGIALFVEYLDDSVKSKEDLERVAPDLAVLGFIPMVGGWKDREATRVVSLEEPTSPAAEAYRSLRTSVQFYAVHRPVGTMLLTSAGEREGKTTTIANLGVALARAGRQVVIVDCDLRRPRVHEFFGLANARGFTSVLLGDELDSALQAVPAVNRLSVLASGPLPPNPSELLATRATTDLFRALQDERYTVLIDSPPLLPVTDALVLAPYVDAVLVVTAAGSTSRKDVGRAVEMLRQAGAPVAGAVLNGVSPAGGYGYTYKYYREEASTKGPAPAAKRQA